MRSATERGLSLALMLFLAACASNERPRSNYPSRPSSDRPKPRPSGPVSDTPVKIGKPYQVGGIYYYPADDANYDEVGYASWYGAQFHGAPTANGEPFDMDRVGAAHKTLPLPSYVEVTALDTGRTILVRINDRGPFVSNRIIDLSRRSAQLLGIERAGVSRVRVRRVYPSDSDKMALRSGRPASDRPYASRSELAALSARFVERRPDRPAPPRVAAAIPAPDVPVGGLFVQVAAFGDRTRAEDVAEGLGGRVEATGLLWRVRMGPYKSVDEAKGALALVQARGYQDARLVNIPATQSSSEGRTTP